MKKGFLLRVFFTTFISAFLILTSACNGNFINQTEDNATKPYPGMGSEPIPNPNSNDPEIVDPLITPVAEKDTGVIVGLVSSYSSQKPLAKVKIYLANKVPLEPGPGYVISFQEKSSPQTDTNSQGQYLITKIPPGEYVILMVTPFGTYPLANDETDQIELDIKAGDVVDVGLAYVNWP